MYILETFKYFSLISLPLFLIIALFLIKKVPEFSFKKHTISKTALFLNNPFQLLIFRFNFILKSLLDLGFTWYLIDRFKFKATSPLFWLLIICPVIFSLLACYLVGKHTFAHRIIIDGYGVLWSIVQILLAQITSSSLFIEITYILSVSALIIAFGFLFAKKTNVIIQAVCISLLYGWLILFVFRYL